MRRSVAMAAVIGFIAALTLALLPGRASAQAYVTVVVQPGDSLGKIAVRYCTNWRTIYDINRQSIGPDPSQLPIGIYLSVPNMCGGPSHLPETPPSGGIYDRGPSTHASGYYNPPYYTVAWGDTLYSIGNRFGLSVDELRRVNGIGDIVAGQTLLIARSGGAPVPPQPQPPQPQPPRPPSVNAERVYFAGGISATRTGIVANGAPKRYILGARAGQVMEVGTSSHGEPLTVTVTQVGGSSLPINGENGKVQNNTWVRIPATADYIVSIGPDYLPESPQLAFDVIFVIQ